MSSYLDNCQPVVGLSDTSDELTDLDHALVNVAQQMRRIRSLVDSAKRRREFLDSAIRANLVEMDDGQFKQCKTDEDKFHMIRTVMTADQTVSDANVVLYHAFNKTLIELQAIAGENGPSVAVLNASVLPH